ncbi:3-hydroxyacyl-CoA dehydrogenase NAD-binding domain-containing protein [Paenibacillus sp. N1-5-1-14]|uniref:3-hydroxyacyl-CoA dehydrogenase NAD-binding domain-containing protein n=1 Tax=Paenibacillus radicibacter TaxID=2972488 RepID=UPI0021593A4F|nr:3-hydroxyacyl-CoA dehydrogenase NAD-binding domain-containing protein [Paenibacillus radicibacter]MCR8641819.1 3-hydroxyacyl-CoA dehydrogenase NAD-binding domain-containing protein [Paenibacillus radicibacter]
MTPQIIGVIGAGTMGAGIAFVCASKGHQVKLIDTNIDVLHTAQSYLEKTLASQLAKGRITEQDKAETLSRFIFSQEMPVLANCDIVIEAVSERIELKKSIFTTLTDICRSDALLLSNTSSLSITAIAGGLAHPERIAGMHFFNPAPVMPLVEVIRGKQTGTEQAERVYQLAESLGKIAVYANDTPGFIVNRIARPFYNESLRILGDHVATVEQIDDILTQAGGFKMGPFALQDLIGIDISFAVTESVYNSFFQEGRFKPSRIQQRMVQAGTLGRKSGEGYYGYNS